jgi:hypothetical protein
MGSEHKDYTPEEAERRFLTALKAALNTPPKPLKDMPKKRGGKRAARASSSGD